MGYCVMCKKTDEGVFFSSRKSQNCVCLSCFDEMKKDADRFKDLLSRIDVPETYIHFGTKEK